MADTVDLNAAINAAFKGIRAQLETAAELSTGPARNVIDNLLDEKGLLNIHHLALGAAANTEHDEYNRLCDELEQRDIELSTLQLKVTNMVTKVRDAELERAEAHAAQAEAESQLVMSREQLRLLQEDQRQAQRDNLLIAQQLKHHNAVKHEAERLKKHNREKQTELDSLRQTHKKMRGELAKVRTARADLEKRLAAAVAAGHSYEQHIANLTEKLMYNDGDTEQRVYHGEQGVEWYFYTFAWGLRCQMADRELIQVDWHMELRTNTGIGVLVMIDTNLDPVFPLTEETRAVPRDLVKAVKQRILERCQHSHPELYARRQWAEETSITELGMTTQLQRKLEQHRLVSVLALLSHTPQKLALFKGIGAKTAEHAHEQALAAARAWTKNYRAQARKAG